MRGTDKINALLTSIEKHIDKISEKVLARAQNPPNLNPLERDRFFEDAQLIIDFLLSIKEETTSLYNKLNEAIPNPDELDKNLELRFYKVSSGILHHYYYAQNILEEVADGLTELREKSTYETDPIIPTSFVDVRVILKALDDISAKRPLSKPEQATYQKLETLISRITACNGESEEEIRLM